MFPHKGLNGKIDLDVYLHIDLRERIFIVIYMHIKPCSQLHTYAPSIHYNDFVQYLYAYIISNNNDVSINR